MSNAIQTNLAPVDARFLSKVRTLAKSEGSSTRSVVELLKGSAIDWAIKAQVSAIAYEYKVGRLMGLYGYDAATAAKIGNAKSAVRSTAEQARWDAANTYWTRVSIAAGKPKMEGKGRPAKKAKGKGASVKPAPLTMENLKVAVPAAKTALECAEFALVVAGAIEAFEKRAKNAKQEGLWQVFNTFVADAKREAEAIKAAK